MCVKQGIEQYTVGCLLSKKAEAYIYICLYLKTWNDNPKLIYMATYRGGRKQRRRNKIKIAS